MARSAAWLVSCCGRHLTHQLSAAGWGCSGPAASVARSAPPVARSIRRALSTTAAAWQADTQQQEPPAGSTGSASEAASSSFINPANATAAAPQPPQQHSPTAGGVLLAAQSQQLEYTMRQVAKHSTDESCWIVVNNKVYDVSSYLDDHPGGADSILQNAGVDCTDEFMSVHSLEAKQLLEKFAIGTVKQKAGAAKPAKQAAVSVTDLAAAAAADPTAPKVLLQDPKERYALPLAQKQQLNPDTCFLRFRLPSPDFRLGLPCGKHVFLCADINGEAVVRAYTPVSGDRDLGVLDFLIKVYWAGSHPLFPEGGKMTQHLAGLKEGDCIDVKGPFGKFCYESHGSYTLNRVPGKARYLSMVAGGSGITPCYDVAREVLQDPTDNTRMSLVYANKHEEDIWLRQELDAMAAEHPDRFHVWYVVEEPQAAAGAAALGAALGSAAAAAGAVAAGTSAAAAASAGAAAAEAGAVEAVRSGRWKFSKGWVTPDMLAQHLLPPRPVILPAAADSSSSEGGSLALMCGPPGMLENVVVPSLTALGFGPEQMVVF